MSTMKSRAFAVLAAACTMLSGAALACPAMAADNTMVATGDLSKPQTLTVSSTEDISGQTFKAIRLARYSAATTNGTDLTGVDVADEGHAASIDAALKASKAVTATTAGYDATNPMAWVVSNMLDSGASPFAGSLRDLITALSKDAGVTGDSNAVTLARGAANTSMSAEVTPGLYLIADATANGRTSIPMLAATGINGMTTLKNAGGASQTLGSVEWKPNTASVTKKILENGTEVDANSAGISDTVVYRLAGDIPNWTGYDKFRLLFEDTLSKGLTFKRITKVTVDGKNLEATLYQASAPAATADGGSTFSVAFVPDSNGVSDLIAHKDRFPVGKRIVVEYEATVNKDAKINTGAGGTSNDNTVSVRYSHRPGNADDLGTTPGNTVKTYVGRLNVVKHDATGKPLKGATFTVSAASAASPLPLVLESAGDKTKPSVYRLAQGQETGATGKFETPESGLVTINGLGSGGYTVNETGSPLGATMLPSFNLTIDAMHGKNAANQFTAFRGDGNKLATSDNAETVTVVNVRNIGELPKTGATWLMIYGVCALLCVTGAIILLARRRS